jgi:ribosomal protein S7
MRRRRADKREARKDPKYNKPAYRQIREYGNDPGKKSKAERSYTAAWTLISERMGGKRTRWRSLRRR